MSKTLIVTLLIIMSVSGVSIAQIGQSSADLNAVGKAHPSPYNVYGVQFPRIEADARVTFQFRAPDAAKGQVFQAAFLIANLPRQVYQQPLIRCIM